MNFGQLNEGIYVVTEIKDGMQIKKIGEHVSELPEALNIATFEPYVYKLSKKLNKFLKNKEETFSLGMSKFVTSKEILDTIRSVIKTGKQDARI